MVARRGLGSAWRGQKCSYCGISEAEHADHIFARSFFPVERRQNLPQTPACNVCGGRKSRLESALSCVLPFGGEHADALVGLDAALDRLDKNERQRAALNPRPAVIQNPDNLFETQLTMVVDLDGEALTTLFEMIVRGLYVYHWGALLSSEYVGTARAFAPNNAVPLTKFLSAGTGDYISNDVGAGAFVYEGRRARDNPDVSAWRFRAMGGMAMMSDQTVPGERLTDMIVTTQRGDFVDELGAAED